MVGLHVLGYRVPGAVLVVAAVGGLAAIPAVLVGRRRWGWARATGWAALAWVTVLTAAVTLSPSDSEGASAGCVVGIDGLFTGWLTDDARLLNVLLFVPLSALVVVLVRDRRRLAVAVGSLLAWPVGLELVQSTGPVGRSCDLADVVDNWTGLAIGAGVGAGISLVARR